MNHALVRVQGPGVENPWFKPLLPPFDKCFYTPRGHGGVWDMALSSVACVRLRPETIKNSPDTFVIIRLFLDVTVTLDVALWEKLMRPGLIPEPTLHQLYNQHTVPRGGGGKAANAGQKQEKWSERAGGVLDSCEARHSCRCFSALHHNKLGHVWLFMTRRTCCTQWGD